MDLLFAVVLAVLVIVAVARIRRRNASRDGEDGLSEDAIRRIEQEGSLEREDPLDFEAIDREHRRFFEETWDEPEEY